MVSEILQFTETPDVTPTSAVLTCNVYGKTPSFCFISPVWDDQVNLCYLFISLVPQTSLYFVNLTLQ